MNILFVSEEYKKLSTGTFRVWSLLCARLGQNQRIDLLLNKEHWLHSEKDTTLAGVNKIFRYPLVMPQTFASLICASISSKTVAAAFRFAFRSLLSFIFAPLLIFWLFFLIRNRRITTVVCHHGGWPAGAFVRWVVLASRVAGVRRCVLVIHNFPTNYLRPLRMLQRLEEWLIGKCADEIVTVSHAAAQALAYRNFRKPIRVIHNGIEIPFAAAASEKIASHQQAPLFGFLGALVPYKGAHVLLDAALQLSPGCRIVLAGPGEAKYIHGLKIHEANKLHDIVFMEFQRDVDAFLERLDVLVVPSLCFESFGMVILEAMLHSKPVICSDFGGMKEIVVDGETGFVVPAGDPKALAAAIRELMSDDELRGQMGAAGYKRLKKVFTAERMAEEHLALLT